MIEETPPADGDPKAENLNVASSLEISVLNVGKTAMTTYKHLPAIRFTADGGVDENSPHTVRIDSGDGGSLWLLESRNKLGYEISDTGK